MQSDDAFECHAKPSTSRTLPSRSCKRNILYAENDEIETEEPNLSDGKNSIRNENEDQPENVENLNESAKNSPQNVVNDTPEENDEEKEDTTKNVWNEQIDEKFSEFKTLRAKWQDDMKKACKHSSEFFEDREKCIQYFLDSWSSDKSEKLLNYVSESVKELERFLAIRGISCINQNTMPFYSIYQTSSDSDD